MIEIPKKPQLSEDATRLERVEAYNHYLHAVVIADNLNKKKGEVVSRISTQDEESIVNLYNLFEEGLSKGDDGKVVGVLSALATMVDDSWGKNKAKLKEALETDFADVVKETAEQMITWKDILGRASFADKLEPMDNLVTRIKVGEKKEKVVVLEPEPMVVPEINEKVVYRFGRVKFVIKGKK